MVQSGTKFRSVVYVSVCGWNGRAAMMTLRTLAMVGAALAIAGCASSGYNDGYYQPQPGYAYQPGYYDQPYYYGGGYSGFGYDSDFDDDSNRYFHPAHGITCDRARDVCFDRYGLSYDATKRYLGEREANRAVHKYDDRILFYSPKPGITCDRRAHFCSDAGGFNEKWTDRIFGDKAGSPPARVGNNGFAKMPGQQDEPWPMNPNKQAFSHKHDDDGDTHNDDGNAPMLPRAHAQPQGLVDNNPPPTVLLPQGQPQGAIDNDNNQSSPSHRPGAQVRVFQPTDDKSNASGAGSGAAACPPQGCSNK
jgi:hypothetical protein